MALILVVGTCVGVLFSSLQGVETLERPAATANRLVDLSLQAGANAQAGVTLPDRLQDWLWPLNDRIEEGIGILTDVQQWLEEGVPEDIGEQANELRARRVVLLGEMGRLDDLSTALAKLEPEQDWVEFSAAVRGAYLGGSITGAFSPPSLPGEGWCRARLLARLEKGAELGLDSSSRETAASLRAKRWQQWERVSVVASFAPMLAGLIPLAFWLLRRRGPGPIGRATLPPAWSAEDGFAVIVRALVCGILITVFLSVLEAVTGWGGWTAWMTLVASLPMIALLYTHLGSPQGLLDTLGLRVAASKWAGLTGFAVFAWLMDAGGNMLIAHGLGLLGVPGLGWSESLFDDMIWNPLPLVLFDGFDGVVWAPLFEEIGFRGLLYMTLRTRLRPVPAALASGAVFATIHLYSIAGICTLLWSALVWALVFERSRSLWPGILCHGYNNLLVLGGHLMLR